MNLGMIGLVFASLNVASFAVSSPAAFDWALHPELEASGESLRDLERPNHLPNLKPMFLRIHYKLGEVKVDVRGQMNG
jgi:hypothetical protein